MALVQSATTTGSTAPTFGSATTAGNLLVAVSVSAGSGTFNQPAGFTSHSVFNASAFAGECWTKIADGTETTINCTLTSGNGNYLIMEFDDAVAGGLGGVVEDQTNLTTAVTSQSTGTATATGTGLAIAVFWGDGSSTLTDGEAYSNSFIKAAQNIATSARGGIWVATKTVSAGSVECTRSCTDDGDEMAGAMIIFLASAGGVSGTIAATLAAFTSAMTGTTTVVGSAAPALSAFTSSMSGTVTVPGTIAVTLDDSTSSISGSVGNSVDGSMSATLASFVSAITGTTSVTGALSAALSAFTSAAQGTTTVIGNMAATLADFTAEMYETVASSSIIRRTLRFARGCFGRKSLDQ